MRFKQTCFSLLDWYSTMFPIIRIWKTFILFHFDVNKKTWIIIYNKYTNKHELQLQTCQPLLATQLQQINH